MRSFLVNTFFLLSLSLSLCAQKGHSTLFGHNDALLYGRYWSDSEEGRKGKKDGELNPKYPGGVEYQKEMLEYEGHSFITKGRKNIRYFVEDYEDKLFELE
mgnify:CR=1 FL=1